MIINWEIFKPTETEILANKRVGKVYVSDFSKNEGKYVSMVFDDKTEPFDIGLQISSRIEVRITYIAHEDKITGVQISKLTNGNKIEKISLSTLSFEGILGLLHIFVGLDLKSITSNSIILDAGIIKDEAALRRHLTTILADPNGLKIISEIAKSNGLIGEGDIGNLYKKKEALSVFNNLMTDNSFFSEKKKEWNKKRDEDVWQHFFETNKWIFGYGLEYVFNAPIEKDKFQQTLKGNNFNEYGKKPDGILKTLGMINFLNIVEIKTDKKDLIKTVTYRDSNVWAVSDELIGAVSQCQQYVRTSIRNLNEAIDIRKENGDRANEEVFCFSPKCFLLIGNMRRDFLDQEGKVINPDKLSCFEYFRKNILTPEIITFDQLFYRAKNIIEHNDE
jgi:hypothetical protein